MEWMNPKAWDPDLFCVYISLIPSYVVFTIIRVIMLIFSLETEDRS